MAQAYQVFGGVGGRPMGVGAFHPGDRVTIRSGAFATMTGAVASPAAVAARWPDMRPEPSVAAGRAYWVVLTIFGRDLPVVLEDRQLAPE